MVTGLWRMTALSRGYGDDGCRGSGDGRGSAVRGYVHECGAPPGDRPGYGHVDDARHAYGGGCVIVARGSVHEGGAP